MNSELIYPVLVHKESNSLCRGYLTWEYSYLFFSWNFSRNHLDNYLTSTTEENSGIPVSWLERPTTALIIIQPLTMRLQNKVVYSGRWILFFAWVERHFEPQLVAVIRTDYSTWRHSQNGTMKAGTRLNSHKSSTQWVEMRQGKSMNKGQAIRVRGLATTWVIQRHSLLQNCPCSYISNSSPTALCMDGHGPEQVVVQCRHVPKFYNRSVLLFYQRCLVQPYVLFMKELHTRKNLGTKWFYRRVQMYPTF